VKDLSKKSKKKQKSSYISKCRQSQQTHRSWHRQWLWWRKRNFEKSNTKKGFYSYFYKKTSMDAFLQTQLDFPALGPKLKLHLNKLPGVSQTPFAGLGVSQLIPQVGTSKKTLLELPKANKAN
jgi:hypothetical protein